MSVEDWARREAEQAYNADGDEMETAFRVGMADGIVHAFSALLSDEAVEAAARTYSPDDWDSGDLSREERNWLKTEARAALQAAVRAVTEGETK